jgi:hypothetical protein
MSFLTATAGTDKATRLRQHAALRFRSGTLAGQLEFLTQGLSLKLDGSFGISR